MARHVCWDMDLVRQVFTTEASTKTCSSHFDRVHLPLDRIRVLDTKPLVFSAGALFDDAGETFTTEDGLLVALASSHLRDPNRIFVFVGEPGSGKSHLARWLEFSLEKDDRFFPIHIPRHVDSLAAVFLRLQERTGLASVGASEDRTLSTPPDKLVRYLIAALELDLGKGTAEGTRQPDLARVIESAAFRGLVEHQVVRYQSERQHSATGLKTREILALGRDDFRHLLSELRIVAEDHLIESWYGRLSEVIRKTLLRVTGFGTLDVKQLLADISRRTVERGVRPVLILEDVTSFDMLHDDLMMFLLDESAGHFDAVVCWTTGFERNYMQTYQEQRYTARLSLTDENGEAYSLKHGRCVDLVRRYLDAVRIHGDECPFCAGSPEFDGLYPFNRTFIERIYENLVTTEREQRRTPRHLLDRAIKGYLEVASSDGPFPPVRQPSVVRDLVYDTALFGYRAEFPSFVSLMAWYAAQDQGALVLDRSVARRLGVMIPDEWDEASTIRIELRLQEHVAGAEVRVASERVAAENRFKALRLELQSWFHYGMPIDHYTELQRGVNRVLGFFRRRLPLHFSHESGVSGAGRPLVYGRDSGETNVFVVGNRAQRPRVLTLDIGPGTHPFPPDQHYVALETALALNVLGGFPEGANFALLDEWAGIAFEDYRQAVENRLREQLGASVVEVLLFAKFLLLNRAYGFEELSSVPITWFIKPFPCAGQRLGDHYDGLVALAERVDGALRALFFISRDVLDYPRLLLAVQRLDPDRLLRALATVAVTKIDEEARFADGGKLADLARALKTTCQAIQTGVAETEHECLRQRVVKVETTMQSTPLPLLIDAVQRLLEKRAETRDRIVIESAALRAWISLTGEIPEFVPGRTLADDLLDALSVPSGTFSSSAAVCRAESVLARPDVRLIETALAIVHSVEEQLVPARRGREIRMFAGTMRRAADLRTVVTNNRTTAQ
jgi:hypothetical protein